MTSFGKQLQGANLFTTSPWRSHPELQALYTNIYNFDNAQSQSNAIEHVNSLRQRTTKLPLSIETTSALVELNRQYTTLTTQYASQSSLQQDPSNHLSLQSLRYSYSSVLIRFVNGLVDALQMNAKHANSVLRLATQLNLPRLLVDIRHSATHNDLPSLESMRIAAHHAMVWLHERYWIPQLTPQMTFSTTLTTFIASLRMILTKLGQKIQPGNQSGGTKQLGKCFLFPGMSYVNTHSSFPLDSSQYNNISPNGTSSIGVYVRRTDFNQFPWQTMVKMVEIAQGWSHNAWWDWDNDIFSDWEADEGDFTEQNDKKNINVERTKKNVIKKSNFDSTSNSPIHPDPHYLLDAIALTRLHQQLRYSLHQPIVDSHDVIAPLLLSGNTANNNTNTSSIRHKNTQTTKNNTRNTQEFDKSKIISMKDDNIEKILVSNTIKNQFNNQNESLLDLSCVDSTPINMEFDELYESSPELLSFELYNAVYGNKHSVDVWNKPHFGHVFYNLHLEPNDDGKNCTNHENGSKNSNKVTSNNKNNNNGAKNTTPSPNSLITTTTKKSKSKSLYETTTMTGLSYHISNAQQIIGRFDEIGKRLQMGMMKGNMSQYDLIKIPKEAFGPFQSVSEQLIEYYHMMSGHNDNCNVENGNNLKKNQKIINDKNQCDQNISKSSIKNFLTLLFPQKSPNKTIPFDSNMIINSVECQIPSGLQWSLQFCLQLIELNTPLPEISKTIQQKSIKNDFVTTPLERILAALTSIPSDRDLTTEKVIEKVRIDVVKKNPVNLGRVRKKDSDTDKQNQGNKADEAILKRINVGKSIVPYFSDYYTLSSTLLPRFRQVINGELATLKLRNEINAIVKMIRVGYVKEMKLRQNNKNKKTKINETISNSRSLLYNHDNLSQNIDIDEPLAGIDIDDCPKLQLQCPNEDVYNFFTNEFVNKINIDCTHSVVPRMSPGYIVELDNITHDHDGTNINNDHEDDEMTMGDSTNINKRSNNDDIIETNNQNINNNNDISNNTLQQSPSDPHDWFYDFLYHGISFESTKKSTTQINTNFNEGNNNSKTTDENIDSSRNQSIQIIPTQPKSSLIDPCDVTDVAATANTNINPTSLLSTEPNNTKRARGTNYDNNTDIPHDDKTTTNFDPDTNNNDNNITNANINIKRQRTNESYDGDSLMADNDHDSKIILSTNNDQDQNNNNNNNSLDSFNFDSNNDASMNKMALFDRESVSNDINPDDIRSKMTNNELKVQEEEKTRQAVQFLEEKGSLGVPNKRPDELLSTCLSLYCSMVYSCSEILRYNTNLLNYSLELSLEKAGLSGKKADKSNNTNNNTYQTSSSSTRLIENDCSNIHKPLIYRFEQGNGSLSTSLTTIPNAFSPSTPPKSPGTNHSTIEWCGFNAIGFKNLTMALPEPFFLAKIASLNTICSILSNSTIIQSPTDLFVLSGQQTNQLIYRILYGSSITTPQPLLTATLPSLLINPTTTHGSGILGWPSDAAIDGGPNYIESNQSERLATGIEVHKVDQTTNQHIEQEENSVVNDTTDSNNTNRNDTNTDGDINAANPSGEMVEGKIAKNYKNNPKKALKLQNMLFQTWAPLVLPLCVCYPGFQTQLLIGLVTVLLRIDLYLNPITNNNGLLSKNKALKINKNNKKMTKLTPTMTLPAIPPTTSSLSYIPYTLDNDDIDGDGDNDEDIDITGFQQPTTIVESIIQLVSVPTLFKVSKSMTKTVKSKSNGTKSESNHHLTDENLPSSRLTSQQAWVIVNIIGWISSLSIPFIPTYLIDCMNTFGIELPELFDQYDGNEEKVQFQAQFTSYFDRYKLYCSTNNPTHEPLISPLHQIPPPTTLTSTIKPTQTLPTFLTTLPQFTTFSHRLVQQLRLYSIPWNYFAETIRTHIGFIPLSHSMVLDRLFIALPFLKPFTIINHPHMVTVSTHYDEDEVDSCYKMGDFDGAGLDNYNNDGSNTLRSDDDTLDDLQIDGYEDQCNDEDDDCNETHNRDEYDEEEDVTQQLVNVYDLHNTTLATDWSISSTISPKNGLSTSGLPNGTIFGW